MVSLFGAFRSLLPREDACIQRFCEHARLAVPAAEAFRALIGGNQPSPWLTR
jgi:hypothetical protein